jgi:hypothetical protein
MEGELADDPIGYRHFLIWDAHTGGDPLLKIGPPGIPLDGEG